MPCDSKESDEGESPHYLVLWTIQDENEEDFATEVEAIELVESLRRQGFADARYTKW